MGIPSLVFYPCTVYVFALLRAKANICVAALPVHILSNLEYWFSSASHVSHCCGATAAISARSIHVLTDQTLGPWLWLSNHHAERFSRQLHYFLSSCTAVTDSITFPPVLFSFTVWKNCVSWSPADQWSVVHRPSYNSPESSTVCVRYQFTS